MGIRVYTTSSGLRVMGEGNEHSKINYAKLNFTGRRYLGTYLIIPR